MNDWLTLNGTIIRGHHVASQASEHYPQGTIQLQLPFFRARGLDLSSSYLGTLNVSIRPHTFALQNPQYTFRQVAWTNAHPPEDFSFSPCRIRFADTIYEGWIYYPHPETKARHFQDPSLIEVIAQSIPHLGYGDGVELWVKAGEVVLGMRNEE